MEIGYRARHCGPTSSSNQRGKGTLSRILGPLCIIEQGRRTASQIEQMLSVHVHLQLMATYCDDFDRARPTLTMGQLLLF